MKLQMILIVAACLLISTISVSAAQDDDSRGFGPTAPRGGISFGPLAGYSPGHVGIFPICSLPYPITGGFPGHRGRIGGFWEQREAWYEPIPTWYPYSLWNRYNYGYTQPRNYSSWYFVSEWKDREPEVCGDDLDAEVCGTSMDFSESILLSVGMTPEAVMQVLGSPIQRIRLAERELWQYSSYSLLFEFGRLKEIR